MKVPVNSIRAGNVIDYNGKLWVASKVQHISPGKGGAFVAIEAKALREGNKLQERFRSGEMIEQAHIDERECTYLFKDENGFTFMDKENYEQLVVGSDVLDTDQSRWLQDGMEVLVSLHEGTPVGVTLPKSVVLAVVEADAVVKGQTASSSYKPAIVEGGIRVMVPPHIGVGTRLVINTEDGSYMERAKD
ncbi:elongation factor P [Enhydrobacter aerosaccus]|uniref:Elongation factor P n=1 Tax=Enhydrobacter aerosaccus TaxID=225324 RepID=A0A1T4K458_9HYPH|nr:elongation factor P [Enhydrobacter aerosaccus]SJZ37199.1 elongation factor P [Enhydrobacter aerosaccus]